jgi:YD repeat-containing protein
VVRALDDDSDVSLVYDSLSRVLSEVQDSISNGVVVHSATVRSTFDDFGNLLALDYPGGRRIEYTYDAGEQLAEVLESGAQQIGCSWLGPQIERIDRAGGLCSTFSYDAELLPNRITHQFQGKGPPLTLWDQQIGHDPTHHRALEVDPATGAGRAWSYDSAGRMAASVQQAALGNQTLVQYLLDDAGNRQQVIGGPGAGSYVLDPTLPEPADAQMHQYSSTPLDARLYDLGGRLLSADGANQSRQFVWDFGDRLVEEIDVNTGNGVTYTCDPFGRRLSKDLRGAAPQTVFYAWSGGQILEERDSAGGTLASWTGVAPDIWTGGTLDSWLKWQSAQPTANVMPYLVMPPSVYASTLVSTAPSIASFDRGGTRHHLLSDDLGSPRVAALSKGQVLERYDYNDFGAPSFFDPSGMPFRTSQIGNPVLFRGMRLESYDGVEILYGTARLYDASAGRMVQRVTE